MKEYFKFYIFFWKFAKKYKLQLFLHLFLFIVLSFGITIFISPFILKYFIDNIQNLSINKGVFLILLYCISQANFLIYAVATYSNFNSFSKITEDIRQYLFSNMLNQSMDYFNKSYSGDIINKFNTITDNIGVISRLTKMNLRNFIYLVIMIAIFFYYNQLIGFITLLYVILFNTVITKMSDKLANKNNISNKYLNKLSALITDVFSNVINIKSFSNNKYENELFVKNLDLIKNANIEKCEYENKINAFKFLFYVIFIINIFGILIYQLINKDITLGTFIFLIEILRLNLENIESILCLMQGLMYKLKNFNESFSIIEDIVKIKDKEDVKHLDIFNGKIEFKNVNFRY